jgi:hypothetical protein
MDDLSAVSVKGPWSGSLTPPALFLVTLLVTLLVLLLVLALPTAADNVPPTAVISSPGDGEEFLVSDIITFDGSQSTDDDLVNLTYEWNFSGQLISGRDMAIVQRTFSTPGDMLVVLRVIDSGGRDDMTFITIHVTTLNQPPVAIIATPFEGQRFLSGKSIAFDGSGSHDPDGGTLVYRWEANGIFLDNKATFNFRLSLGDYLITLEVFDQIGAGGMASINLTVEVNVPPTLSGPMVGPETGPRTGEFNFSVTYRDGDDDPPTLIQVKVGPPGSLAGHEMFRSDTGDVDFMNGVRYSAIVELNAGEHQFVFTCRDLFYSCATALFEGPMVYHIQEIHSPNLGSKVTVNWTHVGTVTSQGVLPPGPPPTETVTLTPYVRAVINPGVWSEARLELEYSAAHLVEEETITLLWYDGTRGLWVPASAQRHDPLARTVQGDMPSDDVTMAVFGRLSEEHVNNPPNLVISYDIEDAFAGEVLWFDASCSTDPDGTVLLFYWDFTDDGEMGPWVPGVRVPNIYQEKGVYQVVLLAIDGGNPHFMHENVTIRAEQEYRPGPWDNPGALFLLASLLIIALGLATAYRLRRPKTYDDLFGKAYKQKDDEMYSQLFRKLTEEEMMGDQGEDEDPEGSPDKKADGLETEEGD